MTLRGLCGASVAVILALGCASTAGAEVVSRDFGFSHVSTYGDAAVWIQGTELRARVDGRVVVMRRAKEGQLRFADLGPDVDGSLVAVYDFCRFRRVPNRRKRVEDCDVFEYDFATRRSSPVTAVNSVSQDEVSPSVWRGRIVFARVPHGPGPSVSLWVDGHGSKRHLRGDGAEFDLRGTQVVYVSVAKAASCMGEEPAKVDDVGVAVPTIVVESLLTGRRRTLDGACETAPVSDVRFPQFVGPDVFWQADIAAPCDRSGPRCNYPTAPHIRHLVAGQVRDVAVGDNRVFTYGISDHDLYWSSIDTPSGRSAPMGASLNRIPRPGPDDPPRPVGPPE